MAKATVEHPVPKHVPILMAGTVTPDVLVDWFYECEGYFAEKEIKDDKRVSKILSGLQDPLIKNWYNPDIARIRALAWEDFQVELKREVLPRHWEDKLAIQRDALRQGETEEFRRFSNCFERLNAVLRGTSDYYDDPKIIAQMKVAVCEDLRLCILGDQTHTIQ